MAVQIPNNADCRAKEIAQAGGATSAPRVRIEFTGGLTPPRSLVLFTFVIGLLSLLQVAFAADELPSARKKISQMTPDERQRLDTNAAEFQQLTPTQQSKLRDLQQAIERDSGLQATLAAYQAWANTLTPLQRSELQKAPDAKSKLQLINEFRRRPGPDPLNPSGDHVPPSRTPDQSQVVMKVLGHFRPPPVPQPSSEEFAALVDVLESRLPAERREVLHKMDSFTRQVHVIADSIQRLRGGPIERRPQEADAELTQQLIDAFENGSPAEQFVKSQSGPARRLVVYPILFRGLVTELILTVDLHFPSLDEVLRFEQALSEGEREMAAKQPPEEWLVEVCLMCLEAKIPGIREFRGSTRNFELMMNPEWRRRGPMFDRGHQPLDGSRDHNRPEPDRDFGPDRSPPPNRIRRADPP